jgi:DNA-binding transcriptional MerR regulator
MTTLVRPGHPADDLDELRARVAGLESALGQRAADADRMNREIDTFAALYRQQVGTLHEQLDELELGIAEAELGELAKNMAEAAKTGEAGASENVEQKDAASSPSRPERAARFTSDAVRKLFRDVAKTIHPDLAHDEHTRDRRHSLMIEANRAYALRDEEQLRKILEAWERSPEAVKGSDPAAVRLRLERRLAQVEEQLEIYARDIAELQSSPLYELKTMVDKAAERGKDLVADMVARLKRDIMAATNRLDAMRSVPKS